MAQAKRSPQQPDESLEKILASYRATLEYLRKTLSYGENLRNIEATSINAFEKDLRDIIEGLEKLRFQPGILHYVTSIDAVKDKLQRARNELYTALDTLVLLEQGNLLQVIEARKNYLYPSFTACEQYLLEALGYFRT